MDGPTLPMSKSEKAEFDRFAAVAASLATCKRWTEKALTSPVISFLTGALPQMPEIICKPCNSDRAGGYSPSGKIILCHDQLLSKTHLKDTLAHELIHAYDQATVKIDFKNISHLACTEIRAASLSGECRFLREVSRGYLQVAKHHQECVKRRAILGVTQGGHSKENATMAVMSVFIPCFNDTAPFDEIF